MPILTSEERLGQLVAERYRLDAVLQTGGMGVLFEAHDVLDEQRVAVKMLKPAYTLEPDCVARFARETQIAKRVLHPNIARTLQVWSDDSGVPFLIMELLEGRTLAHELDERGVLSLPEALALLLPIVRALQAAHALGVVHRDVKPSNIFLARAPDGAITPKLLDFGIAKSPNSAFETETGMLIGTPGYVAPEQAQYGECSALTDVWGIGAVFYRCLSGHAPHAGPNVSDLLVRLLREPVPPLSAPGVNKQACATIDRALARDPSLRYPSMNAFGRALEEFLDARVEDLRFERSDALDATHAERAERWTPMAAGAARVKRASARTRERRADHHDADSTPHPVLAGERTTLTARRPATKTQGSTNSAHAKPLAAFSRVWPSGVGFPIALALLALGSESAGGAPALKRQTAQRVFAMPTSHVGAAPPRAAGASLLATPVAERSPGTQTLPKVVAHDAPRQAQPAAASSAVQAVQSKGTISETANSAHFAVGAPKHPRTAPARPAFHTATAGGAAPANGTTLPAPIEHEATTGLPVATEW